jgi:hypothetical protein
MNATNLSGRKEDSVRFGFCHPSIDLFTMPQIKIQALWGQNFTALRAETPNNGRPDHTGVARHVYPLME